jgi:hypothetical protein
MLINNYLLIFLNIFIYNIQYIRKISKEKNNLDNIFIDISELLCPVLNILILHLI